MSILNIKARQILDSRGNPTVEVDLTTQLGVVRASVPSGASTGKYQALQLRDHNPHYYLGKGVLKAVENVNAIIAPTLKGKDVTKQCQLDKFMVQQLDGTQNQYGWCKSKLGANAILAVSLAIAKAGAAVSKLKLYQYIRTLANIPKNDKFIMPCPAFNVINGGKHGGNGLSIQQFMIFPTGAKDFSQALQIGAQVYHHLMKLIRQKYGLQATNVGDEGGFAPNVNTGKQALDLLIQAISRSGHKDLVEIGMDCAASQFYDEKTKTYDMNFKDQKLSKSQKWLTSQQLKNLYVEYTKQYPITSIQDPFDQDDTQGWKMITKDLSTSSIQIVGDDLLVTNKKRIQRSIKQKHCTALLLKVNQIGSLTEAIEASLLSKQNGWGTMVSHRSGQTEDTYIADLVVGLGTGQIKSGAPCRSQRTAKYNQLLRIEEQLGQNAIFCGKNFKFPYKLLQ